MESTYSKFDLATTIAHYKYSIPPDESILQFLETIAVSTHHDNVTTSPIVPKRKKRLDATSVQRREPFVKKRKPTVKKCLAPVTKKQQIKIRLPVKNSRQTMTQKPQKTNKLQTNGKRAAVAKEQHNPREKCRNPSPSPSHNSSRSRSSSSSSSSSSSTSSSNSSGHLDLETNDSAATSVAAADDGQIDDVESSVSEQDKSDTLPQANNNDDRVDTDVDDVRTQLPVTEIPNFSTMTDLNLKKWTNDIVDQVNTLSKNLARRKKKRTREHTETLLVRQEALDALILYATLRGTEDRLELEELVNATWSEYYKKLNDNEWKADNTLAKELVSIRQTKAPICNCLKVSRLFKRKLCARLLEIPLDQFTNDSFFFTKLSTL